MNRLFSCLPALVLATAMALPCAANSSLPHPLPKVAKLHYSPPAAPTLAWHSPMLLKADPNGPKISFPAKVNIPLRTEKFDITYYWFLPCDLYNDWATLSQETFEWWIYTGGAVIDTCPTGGTLLEIGYLNSTMPHSGPPAIFLYMH